MFGIIFALTSYFSWGSADIFSTSITRKVGSLTASFWTYILGFLSINILLPFMIKNIPKFSAEILIINIILGIILWIAWPIFLEALRIGNASIVGTIAGSFGAVVVLFSVIFLKETILPPQIISIVLIVIGIILSSVNLSELKLKAFLENKGTLFALITLLCWGIYFTFIKIPTVNIGWFWSAYITEATGAAMFLIVFFLKEKNLRKFN